MAALSASPLTLRDFIQRIFPTVIAVCLFVPFVESLRTKMTLESIISGGAILGYLIADPMKSFSRKVTSYVPFFRKRLKSYERRWAWIKLKWNLDRLQSYLTKDENEYVDQLGSRAIFDQVTIFYLMIYLALNLYRLFGAFRFGSEYWPRMKSAEHLKGLLATLTGLRTPMIGDWQAPTLLLVLAVPIVIGFLFKDFLLHFNLVFLEQGQYDILADKYHRAEGDIATSVWGLVTLDQKPLVGKRVELLKNSSAIDQDKTNERGYFQFKWKYEECLDATCTVRVYLDGQTFSKERKFEAKTPPGFIFHLSSSAPAPATTVKDNLYRRIKKRVQKFIHENLCHESSTGSLAETSQSQQITQDDPLVKHNSRRDTVADEPRVENQTDGNAAQARVAQTFKRIMLVANKKWEADPLMNVLLESKACPMKFNIPAETLKHPLPVDANWQAPCPRAVLSFKEKSRDEAGNEREIEVAQVEIWCIEDWMNPAANKSSTNEKIKILPGLFHWGGRPDPDFVVAFGTAAFLGQTSYNGCVVVGARAFLHSAFSKDDPNPESPWDASAVVGHIKATLDAKLGFFNPKELDSSVRFQAEARFIPPPLNPARDLLLIAAHNYTALGVVNVTNYDDYTWADRAALKAFQDTQPKNPIGSVETTHGIIRLQSAAPFIFISGIVDREDSFNMEVTPRGYAQNFVGAHNAGVAAAWLIPRIVSLVKSAATA
jgi:hypothetical protein